jgi:hypothetical protein
METTVRDGNCQIFHRCFLSSMLLFSLNSINRLVFVMEAHSVFCEIEINFFDCLTLEDRINRVSRNVGKKLLFYTA